MPRIVIVLTLGVGLLLLSSVVTGFHATVGRPGRGETHAWLGGLAGLAVTGLHAMVLVHLRRTSRRVAAVVRNGELPDWPVGQAESHARRIVPFAVVGMGLVGVAVVLGTAARWGAVGPLWHIGVSSAMLGFQVGTGLVAGAAIMAQVRYLQEVRRHAGCRRLGSGSPEPDVIRSGVARS